MVTRQSGIRFFKLGEKWRNAFILGTQLKDIAKNANQNQQTVSRAMWLSRIPEEIKNEIQQYPEIFTRKLLLDTFAAKRRQCEKEGFKRLAQEVKRYVENGIGTKSNLKKTNQKRKPIKKEIKTNPIINVSEALSVESKIKAKLKTHCRVTFDIQEAGGEIRIFFNSKDELEKILAKIENL